MGGKDRLTATRLQEIRTPCLSERDSNPWSCSAEETASFVRGTGGSNPLSSSGESRANRRPSEHKKAEKAPIYAHGDELRAEARNADSDEVAR